MWTLYHTALQAWWLADDPALLKNIVEHGIFSHFYQSEARRSLNILDGQALFRRLRIKFVSRSPICG